MAYIDTNVVAPASSPDARGLSTPPLPRKAIVAILEDDAEISDSLAKVLEFLDLHMVSLPSDQNLPASLAVLRPMAVITGVEMRDQDGCHVLMEIAQHDAALPVLMITGADFCMAGAIDAVEEIFSLTALTKRAVLPSAGEMVEFLAEAGRAGQCLNVIPA